MEIWAMLAVVDRDASGQVLDKRMKYTADHNRTIILLLLDTTEIPEEPKSPANFHLFLFLIKGMIRLQ